MDTGGVEAARWEGLEEEEEEWLGGAEETGDEGTLEDEEE